MGFTFTMPAATANLSVLTVALALLTAGEMAKPIATKGKVNFKTLAAELRAHIEKQEQAIDDNNRELANIMRMQNKMRLEIDNKNKGISSGGGDAGGDDEKA